MERINLGDKIKFTRDLEGMYWQHGIGEAKRNVFHIAEGDTAIYNGNSTIRILTGQSKGQVMLLQINSPVAKI